MKSEIPLYNFRFILETNTCEQPKRTLVSGQYPGDDGCEIEPFGEVLHEKPQSLAAIAAPPEMYLADENADFAGTAVLREIEEVHHSNRHVALIDNREDLVSGFSRQIGRELMLEIGLGAYVRIP